MYVRPIPNVTQRKDSAPGAATDLGVLLGASRVCCVLEKYVCREWGVTGGVKCCIPIYEAVVLGSETIYRTHNESEKQHTLTHGLGLSSRNKYYWSLERYVRSEVSDLVFSRNNNPNRIFTEI